MGAVYHDATRSVTPEAEQITRINAQTEPGNTPGKTTAGSYDMRPDGVPVPMADAVHSPYPDTATRHRWALQKAEQHGLSYRAQSLLLHITLLADSPSGCPQSREKMIAQTRLKKRSLEESAKQLLELGLLEVVHRNGRHTFYRIPQHEIEAMLHPQNCGPADSAPVNGTQETAASAAPAENSMETAASEFDPAEFNTAKPGSADLAPAENGPRTAASEFDPAENSMETASSTPIPQKTPFQPTQYENYEYNNNEINISNNNYSYSHIPGNSESVPAETSEVNPAETASSPGPAESIQLSEESRNDKVASDGNTRSQEKQRSTSVRPGRTAGSTGIAHAGNPLDKEAELAAIQSLDEAVRSLAQATSPPEKYNPNYVAAMLREYRDVHPWPDEAKALTFYGNRQYEKFKLDFQTWQVARWLRADHNEWEMNKQRRSSAGKYSAEYERRRKMAGSAKASAPGASSEDPQLQPEPGTGRAIAQRAAEEAATAHVEDGNPRHQTAYK